MPQQENFKYPRTFHFPESRTVGSDDKIFHDWKEKLQGKLVEISIKYDGENTIQSLIATYNDHKRHRNSPRNDDNAIRRSLCYR